MRKRIDCPITVRGVTYPDPDAAAAALGVSRSAVLDYLRDGKLDLLGLRAASIQNLADLCPFTVRGQEFASFAACADHFGISEKAVKNAVRNGRAEVIGIPAHKTRKRHGPDPMEVRIRGRVFANVNAAAKHFKVTPETIRSAIQRGREDFVGLGRARKHVKKTGRGAHNAKPVQIGIHSWPSLGQCAAALGVKRTSLCDRIRRGDKQWLAARIMDMLARKEGHRAALPAQQDEAAKSKLSASMRTVWAGKGAKALPPPAKGSEGEGAAA